MPDGQSRPFRLGALAGRLSVPLTQVPRAAAGMAVEAGWVSAHLAMYPYGLITDRSQGGSSSARRRRGLSLPQRGLLAHDVDAAGTPILLVHGIVDNHTIFSSLERALRRRGFERLRFFDYGLLTSDVRTAATRLASAVDELVSVTGRDQIHIIGHSLGGLIARYYVQRMGGDERVHTLVTLGSPHQGTRLARVGQLVPLVRQLTPGSALLTELAQPAANCRTRFLAFWSDLDQLVVPRQNAAIDHPDLAVTNVAVRGVGHMSLTNNRPIATQIAGVLADLNPAADRPSGPDRPPTDA